MGKKSKLFGSFISYIMYKLTHNMNDDELLTFVKAHPLLIKWEMKATEQQLEKSNIDLDELEKSRVEIRARIDEQLKKT